jgi:hypothetical protein
LFAKARFTYTTNNPDESNRKVKEEWISGPAWNTIRKYPDDDIRGLILKKIADELKRSAACKWKHPPTQTSLAILEKSLRCCKCSLILRNKKGLKYH